MANVTNVIYASRNIGDIFYSLRLETTLNGAYVCNGAEFNASDFGTNEDFNPYNLCLNGKIPYVSYAEFDSQVSATGSCAKFGIDQATGKFRVPKIKDIFIEATDSGSSVGSYLAPSTTVSGNVSLSITVPCNGWSGASGHGNAGNAGYLIRSSGAREVSEYLESIGRVTSDRSFSQSKSISLTGSQVQPKSIRLRAFVQLLTSEGLVEEEDEPTVELRIPYVFVPGTEAKATEVNANFQYILNVLRGVAEYEPLVHLAGDETITGNKTFTGTSIFNNIRIKPVNGGSGSIAFYYDTGSAMTSRIYEAASGYLALDRTPAATDNSTKIATTNFVKTALNSITGSGSSIISEVSSKFSSSGWCRFSNGLMFQWGQHATNVVGYGGGYWASFPTSFPHTCLQMAQSTTITQGTGNKGDSVGITQWNASQFYIFRGTENWAPTLNWIAIGY